MMALLPTASIAPMERPALPVDTFHVFVSARGFTLCWFTVATLHLVCVFFYVGTAWLYKFFPTTVASWLLTGYDLSLPPRHFQIVTIVFSTIAALHGYALLVMLVASLRDRRLSFTTHGSTWTLFRCRRKSPHSVLQSQLQLASRTMSATSSAAQLVVGKTGLLGIASVHFDVVLLVRETVQCVLQTYQGFVLSQLLPRPHLNRLFVACIVINCWSTPAVSRLVRRDVPRQRVWCLAFDVALDFVSTVVVPTAIFVTYFAAFDVAENNFSAESYYVGSFLVRVITEFQIFWVQSWLDLGLRVLFALNLLSCVDVIKSMIRRQRPQKHAVHHQHHRLQTGDDDDQRQQPRSPSPPVTTARRRRVSRVLVMLGHATFLVGGILVLVWYVYAASRPDVPQCVLQVHPWLTSKPSCASLQLNCHVAGTTGAESDVDRILSDLYEPSLVFVYLRHCEALHLPPRVRRLRRLMGLFIHNSTLVQWGEDAAVSMETHPNMRMFSLVRVRVDRFPAGLLAASFPTKLTDMSIIDVNLTAAQIPTDLDAKWPQVLYLYWEQGSLEDVPMALTRLPNVVDLSLSGNRIAQLPAALLELPSLWALRLNGNPLAELPDALGLAVSPWLGCLHLESTRVTRLPSWLSREFWTTNGGVLAAANTTLCALRDSNQTLSQRQLVASDSQLPLLPLVRCEPLGASFFGVDVDFVLSSSSLA